MRVHWTDAAEGHFDAIYDYIAQDSPEYATRMVDRLTRRSQQIAKFPFSGRGVPEYDVDQIREGIDEPYRITYYIKPDQVDILAVIHGEPWMPFALQMKTVTELNKSADGIQPHIKNRRKQNGDIERRICRED